MSDAAFSFNHMAPGGGAWVGGVGGPDEIDKVTVTYTWTFYNPVLWPFFNNGRITLSVDSSMKNESRWQSFQSPTAPQRRGTALLEFSLVVPLVLVLCWASSR